MRRKRSEIGVHNGHRYLLVYNRMCDEGGWESKAWRWFLDVDDYYIGDFRTKAKAIAAIH